MTPPTRGFLSGFGYSENMKRVALLCLLLAAQAQADEWTNKDTAWQFTYLLFHSADWLQTNWIQSHPNENIQPGYHHAERNSILGDHPTRGEVNRYFILTGLAHTGIAYLLPSQTEILGFEINLRRIWQFVWIGIEGDTVRHNYSAGVRFDF